MEDARGRGDVRSRGLITGIVLDESRGRGKYPRAPAPNCGDELDDSRKILIHDLLLSFIPNFS